MTTKVVSRKFVLEPSARGSEVGLVREERLAVEMLSVGAAAGGVAGVVGARCHRVLDHLLKVTDAKALEEAAKAASDLGVLFALLGRAEVAALPTEVDALAGARLRGVAQKRELLQRDGGSKTTAEVAAMLKVSPQAITKRRKQGKLIAVELGTKGFHYPVWQLDLLGLDEVLAVMRVRDGWEQIGFFLNPNDALGGKRPLDVMRRKQVALAKVVEAAQEYGEAGA